MLALLAALVGGAWLNARLGWWRVDAGTNYALAVAGGLMMLALFSYPARKYLRAMQRAGSVKAWFWLHLGLGIGGPWLILVHSNFHIGSLNAGVALLSMVVVVLSGVVGRVIYVRVHRGLDGERTTLFELKVRAGRVESDARWGLKFAPEVEQLLAAFEQPVIHRDGSWAEVFRHALLLPLAGWRAERRCRAVLARRVAELAAERGWTADEAARRERSARRLVARFIDAVVRVAQFSAFERLFALWHVAHLPFVYLLVISAVVHVVAVHAY